MSDSKIKLGIATPSTGTIKTKTVESLIGMCKNLPFDYVFLSHEGSILHYMRERLVKKAIDLNCTHLLFVDSDMVFKPEAVLKLIEDDKDIVGVNYRTRQLPGEETSKYPVYAGASDLREAISVATGFMLIKLSIFEFLPEPWFFWESNTDGGLVLGEDFWFCRLAQEKGFKVWVDLGLHVGHIGDWIF